MNRRTEAWQNGCFRKIIDHLVNSTPDHHPPKNFSSIILATVVRYSSTSPKQLRQLFFLSLTLATSFLLLHSFFFYILLLLSFPCPSPFYLLLSIFRSSYPSLYLWRFCLCCFFLCTFFLSFLHPLFFYLYFLSPSFNPLFILFLPILFPALHYLSALLISCCYPSVLIHLLYISFFSLPSPRRLVRGLCVRFVISRCQQRGLWFHSGHKLRKSEGSVKLLYTLKY